MSLALNLEATILTCLYITLPLATTLILDENFGIIRDGLHICHRYSINETFMLTPGLMIL